tara:strand:+ start:29673 stop:30035 length:363 start_codon:yes stop_codon:yes gene_type:complete
MKYLIALLISTNTLFAASISGVVDIKGDIPKGVLYVFAKKFSGMPMPLAVKRIENPKFPLKFTLNDSDKMMKNMPFVGPFKVVARISPSGSATDKSGIEVSTTAPVEDGEKELKLVLKKD